MVQAVENWCCVSGIIEGVTPPRGPGRPDQVTLSIRVANVAPVADYLTLLRAEDAHTVAVVARRTQIGNVEVAGRRVTMPVRVAGPDRCFAHPDWSLSRGSPMCGPN